MKLNSSQKIFATPRLPGDKSISHRCLILASLVEGISKFENISLSQDVLSTQKILMQLGIELRTCQTTVEVLSKGYYKKPPEPLDCGNAGTLMRLMMGVLSGQEFESNLVGDKSLSQRPMKRVSEPLSLMGADIHLTNQDFAPIHIKPSILKPFHYNLRVSSAQVKSAILLAGLFVKNPNRSDKMVTLTGKIFSRDHTERLLKFFGAEIEVSDTEIILHGESFKSLHNISYRIPNDVSAASFWVAAGLLAVESEVLLENVGINPTRMGFINVLKKSGANITIKGLVDSPEPTANIIVRNSKLNAFSIEANEVPFLIDEIPLLALIATQSKGTSTIKGVQELRFKESDRVKSTVQAIKALGGQVNVIGDDLIIEGSQKLQGGTVDSKGDHRIAMMGAISRFCVVDGVQIEGFDCAEISDPYFVEQIKILD